MALPRSLAFPFALLAERFSLPTAASETLAYLLSALAEPGAPTAVRDPNAALDVHLADSLVALELAEIRSAGRLADIGSGAGLPGLALAAALPATSVTLVESNHRKAQWAQATAERCGLTNVEVAAVRAEEWHAGLDSCDVVTARALAALPVLVEYAAPLLTLGGALVAWKGAVEAQEAADGGHAAALLGLSEPSIHSVTPFAGSRRRTLWTLRKVSPTPPGYPRRAGMAAKRPLTAPTP